MHKDVKSDGKEEGRRSSSRRYGEPERVEGTEDRTKAEDGWLESGTEDPAFFLKGPE